MKVGNDKIKDLFSSKLGNFEPEVPASVWGGLDQLLSNQPATPTDPSSSTSSSATTTGKASVIKTIAIAVGLVAAVVTGILILSPGDEIVLVEEPQPVMTEKLETPKILKEEDVPVVIAQQRQAIIEEPVIEEYPEVIEEFPEIEETPKPEKEKPVEKRKFAEPKREAVVEKVDLSSPSVRGLSFGIIADAGLLSSSTNERGGGLLFSRNIRSKTFIDALEEEAGEYVLEHKKPVSLGVTIGKQLSPRMSLETGLLYTHLSSKVTSNSMFMIDESQSFDYLGIPIYLNYTFYQLGDAKLYMSVGGMLQKDIKGQYISNIGLSKPGEGQGILNDIYYLEPYHVKKSIKQSNPQFSVRTTLGVAYPLYKKLYLYGTVGGAYYFDANNKYRTIYSDKKTQLDVNLGVKFDF